MTKLTRIVAGVLMAGYLAAPFTAFAAEKAADKKKEKLKPYTLKTCIVTDEKLGEMGEPFVFAHKGQEIKICCKGCQKDFKKAPDKYLKKLEKAQKEAKDKTKKPA